MNLYIIILEILWFAAAISVMAEVAPHTKSLSFWKKIIVAAILIAGAPFMLVVQALELILDIFLEEGWNDNDDEDKFKY